ncbi:MAG: cytoplasmic protein [Desulfobacter sp.]|nr:cytoplasmic protein [Desulfobacter sp.]WDP85242.1 MAG: cytoplasmic protein [Desulfobacter sp.]
MNKMVLFAFRGDPLCFIHVLLNSIEMKEKGQEGLIVLEGESVTLVEEMAKPGHFLNTLYQKAKSLNLFYGACRACATKLKAIEAIEKEGIELVGKMSGHPSMTDFTKKGYKIITF